MSDFIVLHNSTDRKEFAVRARDIRMFCETETATKVIIDGYDSLVTAYVEESVFEIGLLIRRAKN